MSNGLVARTQVTDLVLSDERKTKAIEMIRETGLAPKARLLPGGVKGIELAGTVIPSIEGVILYFKRANIYAIKDGEERTIKCFSFDGVVPAIGVPEKQSPYCSSCGMNQFEEDEDTHKKHKACRNLRRTIVLTLYSPIPVTFTLPPTSLRNFNSFLSNLNFYNYDYDKVLTKVTTETMQKGGFDVSIAKFEKVRDLSKDELIVIAGYKEIIKATIDSVTGQILLAEEEQTPTEPVVEPGQ